MSFCRLYVVNAFSVNDLGGNPAGVVLDADTLSDTQMAKIANSSGHPETAFVSKSALATHKLRFLTPTNEIDLCGHATIAAWSLLYALGCITAGSYTQETRSGILGITITDDGLVFMEQKKAQLLEVIPLLDVVPLLDIPERGFQPTLYPRIVSTGMPDLLVGVNDEATLNMIKPNRERIIAFSREHAISAVHVFCLLDSGESIAKVRNFAPIDGIDEEAATGTSNGALLCYLRQQNKLVSTSTYRIEQGEGMGCSSHIYGKFARDGTVWIGGKATVVHNSRRLRKRQ